MPLTPAGRRKVKETQRIHRDTNIGLERLFHEPCFKDWNPSNSQKSGPVKDLYVYIYHVETKIKSACGEKMERRSPSTKSPLTIGEVFNDEDGLSIWWWWKGLGGVCDLKSKCTRARDGLISSWALDSEARRRKERYCRSWRSDGWWVDDNWVWEDLRISVRTEISERVGWRSMFDEFKRVYSHTWPLIRLSCVLSWRRSRDDGFGKCDWDSFEDF